MKRHLVAIAVAAAMTLSISASAFAWHVDTGNNEREVTTSKTAVTVQDFGPKADPFHRIKVKVVRGETTYGECTGWVEVPNESWANGTTFTVMGTNVSIGKGERAYLPAGFYRGEWSNSSEVEQFDIGCGRVFTAALAPEEIIKHVRWEGMGRDGWFSKYWRVEMAPNETVCTLTPGWRWLKGNTQSRVRINGVTRHQFKAAAPGNYGLIKWRPSQQLYCR